MEFNFKKEINRLNRKQKESYSSILEENSRVLTAAVPGSGKTNTITMATAALLIEKKVSPKEIFLSTFTKKAASEMKDRLFKILGEKSNELNIHTFHAFCYKALKSYAPIYGYKDYADFKLIDQENQIQYFKDKYRYAIKKYMQLGKLDEELGAKIYSEHKKALDIINNLKLELYPREDYAKEHGIVGIGEATFETIVSYSWGKYESYKKEKNYLDFNDVMNHMNDLLDDLKFRRAMQRFTKYIIVDEFQDTNHVQMSIIDKLFHSNIACFGDENQSIYKFRKADINIFRDFAKKYNAKVINMNMNYRSHKIITDAATELIKSNSNQSSDIENYFPLPKEYITEYQEFNSYIDEAEWIANFIESNKSTLGSIGVIYRNNSISDEIAIQLKKRGIFYNRKEEYNIFERKEVKILLDFINLYKGSKEVIPIIFSYKKGIGKKAIEKIKASAEKNKTEFLQEALKSSSKLVKEFAIKIKSFVTNEDLNNIMAFRDHLYSEFVFNRLDKSRLKNVNYLFKVFYDFKTISNIKIDDLIKTTENTLNLTTIHGSKGLEYDTVIIPAMSQDILPSKSSLIQGELEEERRLAYVAMTRARKNLIFTHALNRIDNDKPKTYSRSQFLSEFDMKPFGFDNSGDIEEAKLKNRIQKNTDKIFDSLLVG